MNGFLILFEYVKLKIGKEKRQNMKKKEKKKNQSSLVATVTTSKKQTVRLFKWL